MNELLDTRLRDLARALVHNAPPPPPWPDDHAAALAPAPRRSRSRALVALALVVVAALGIYAIVELVGMDSRAARHIPAVVSTRDTNLGTPVTEQLFGIRTTADGRGVLIRFSGIGLPGNASCSASYQATASETSRAVDISLVGYGVERALACHGGGYPHRLTVALERPLHGRDVLVNLAPVRVFDGTRLVSPSWLPSGWELRGEGGPTTLEAAETPRVWYRSWSPPRPTSTPGQCIPAEMGLTLNQGAVRDGASEIWNQQLAQLGGQQLTSHPRIHRTTGSYYTSPKGSTLVWQESDQVFGLATDSICDNDKLPSLATMLHLARSLRPPT